MSFPILDEFVSAVREFCFLAEREELLEESDLWKIRSLLLRLILHIPAVDRVSHSTSFEGLRPDDVTYGKVVRKFGEFPFNHYRVVFDPHDFEAVDEPVWGSLSDDLADIYRDLAGGLSTCDEGSMENACFEWSFSYQFHWARHAVNALAAIEIYRTANHLNVDQRTSG